MSLGSAPFVLVIAAPSGTGKTTLARALVERNESVVFSVSATTRPPRSYEKWGEDYHFVSDGEFDRMIEDEQLVEWAEVHGRRYGTPRASIDAALREGNIAVLDIDIQGARQIRRVLPEAVLVFILPPSGEELYRRLAGRGSEMETERRRRMTNARRELPAVKEFDYVVVNDRFDTAVRTLESVLEAESHRVGRQTRFDCELDRLDKELAKILERSG